MSSVPDYSKLPVERVTVSRPSYSKPEDLRLCSADFFKKCQWSWVGKGCLNAVEDQGKCCACWAFVGAEAISALYYLAWKQSKPYKLDKLKPLSKQHAVDCMYPRLPTPKNIKYSKNTGCFPSHYNKFYQFATVEGIYPDKLYPYVEEKRDCRCLPGGEKTKIRGFYKVGNVGKETVEKFIRQQPLSGCISHVDSFRKHTGKDIYMGPSKKDIEDECVDKENNQESEGRHAVLIVGYGKENGIEYFLVKNSWGVNWGYWGYAKVKRSVISGLSYPVLDEAV
ncbi:PREDICTED: ervatamin-B-like [Nicotiana attenuata]|uniref:ervatamin-B-like n=1 Tax=Nicotiana attenuata TaxID=49451 RepID=UPI0009046A12|nr:PREDICTED: ervatamin-B-like [Nicotiana attenuata]